MYYLSVSVGEEPGHGLAGPSALGFLAGCNHSISRHCSLISKLKRGRTRPELTWLLAGFGSSRVAGLRASIPCWLLARGCPQILAMWTLLHWSAQAERATERLCQQEEIIIFCSLITEVPFHQVCHILVIRNKSLGPTQTQEEQNYTETWLPGGGARKEPCQKLPVSPWNTPQFFSFSHTLYPIHQATQQAVHSKQHTQNPSIVCSNVTR